MIHSNTREDPDATPERDREQRIEAIKRWVAYIESEPPETWGPQLNTLVDNHLHAAQGIPTSAAHRQHVDAVAREIVEERDRDHPE